MTIQRKFFFLGFAIYIFSYFLPAIPVFNEPISGYESAVWLFGLLFKYKGFLDYAFTSFTNLANMLPSVVFVLHFRYPFRNLIVLQVVAFISALFWAGLALYEDGDLSGFYIGYWNWLFGIFFMLIAMLAEIRRQKRRSRGD